MIDSITSPGDWARFGLAGLVIAALFAQVRGFLIAIRKKDQEHQSFIKEILDDDRLERREDRREHKETTNRLSEAIETLTIELKSGKLE